MEQLLVILLVLEKIVFYSYCHSIASLQLMSASFYNLSLNFTVVCLITEAE